MALIDLSGNVLDFFVDLKYIRYCIGLRIKHMPR